MATHFASFVRIGRCARRGAFETMTRPAIDASSLVTCMRMCAWDNWSCTIGNWIFYLSTRAPPTRISLRQYRLSARSLTPPVGSSEQGLPQTSHTHTTPLLPPRRHSERLRYTRRCRTAGQRLAKEVVERPQFPLSLAYRECCVGSRLHLALEEAAGADVDDVEDVEARDDRGRDEGDQAWDA